MVGSTLSVAMANYNHGRFIGEALEAILAQSFRPLEIIVVAVSIPAILVFWPL